MKRFIYRWAKLSNMSEFGGCFSENNSFLNERCNKTKINGITTIGFAQLLLYL